MGLMRSMGSFSRMFISFISTRARSIRSFSRIEMVRDKNRNSKMEGMTASNPWASIGRSFDRLQESASRQHRKKWHKNRLKTPRWSTSQRRIYIRLLIYRSGRFESSSPGPAIEMTQLRSRRRSHRWTITLLSTPCLTLGGVASDRRHIFLYGHEF